MGLRANHSLKKDSLDYHNVYVSELELSGKGKSVEDLCQGGMLISSVITRTQNHYEDED